MEQRPFNHIGFSEYLGERKLMGSRCKECGAVYLPPRALCTHCYSTEMEWYEFSGAGELAGFTTIYVAPTQMLAEGFNRDNPYCSGVVRLVEGPAISGQLLGLDCAHPEQIQIGAPLQAAFIERGSGENRRYYLAFEQKSTD